MLIHFGNTMLEDFVTILINKSSKLQILYIVLHFHDIITNGY